MLTEDRRKQLDGIVSQMVANKENDNAISFVVNDFKNKYSVQEPEKTFSEKTAGVLDMIFGGGKIGEEIGTQIAKGNLGTTIQKAVVGKDLTPEEEGFVSEGPSKAELFGSALQSAALFTPIGTTAKGISAGLRGLGMVKGVSAAGKIGSGVIAGELFDVASNLQQGKTGSSALTPGLGALIGGVIPAAGTAKNVIVRFNQRQSPRIINSLIKPLAKDFSYGKNPGRAVSEEHIIANNFDDLLTGVRTSRQKVGQEIGALSDKLSVQPVLSIRSALSPLDEAAKVAASQNNQSLLSRLNNVKRTITEVLEPTLDDAGNLSIKSVGSRDLENLTFKQVRNILGDIGDLTAFTGNPSDDKLVNSALKRVYGLIKNESLTKARIIDPVIAKRFEKLTEKYADLTSAEIATKYRDKILERQNLIGLTPATVGIGSALVTAIATGGASIPVILAGVSGAVIDKLASTPAFKTRLAFLLSKKTPQEVNFLFRKIPALSKFFSLKGGVAPGDVILGDYAPRVEKGIANAIKNPKLGLSIEDVSKKTSSAVQKTNDLTTKILKDLEGKTTVSKQYILDATNRGELKQVERDLIREALATEKGDTINVSDFAKKVKAELLPLKRRSTGDLLASKGNAKFDGGNAQYENIALSDDLRGNVKNYTENIYESPITTSAGSTHFGNKSKNYFGHTRIEDMADNKTRRVIEVQSDLYQKGNLIKEKEVVVDSTIRSEVARTVEDIKQSIALAHNLGHDTTKLRTALKNAQARLAKFEPREKEIAKLQQYNDPTAHFRMIREEIKKAAQDGKTKLQFPTGETAMKIEGLGNNTTWFDERGGMRGQRVKPEELKVGKSIVQGTDGNDWIITDVLGDGKFKAVQKDTITKRNPQPSYDTYKEIDGGFYPANRVEEFDISGKVDTNNPIYKFYEKDVQRYLSKFGGKRIVDDKGVSWIEIPITKEQGKLPVEAFGLVGLTLIGLGDQK